MDVEVVEIPSALFHWMKQETQTIRSGRCFALAKHQTKW